MEKTISTNLQEAEDRITSIASFVQARLKQKALQFPGKEHNPTYRWEHTVRVAHYGKILALAEGADVEVVIAACLLHDVAHFESDDDYKDHGRRGAEICRPMLKNLGYTQEMTDNICFSIASHVDGNAGFDHPMTIEAQCVTDADNIDRFGVYRILRWCVPEMEDFPRLVEKLTLRVEQLREYKMRPKILETETGDRLFREQLERQIQFFQAIIEEYDFTSIPAIMES